nr:T9SS type A sorting domain-containing protein [uncultured Prevotella sp.]
MRRLLLTFLFAVSLLAVLPQRMSAAVNIEIIDNDFQQVAVTVNGNGVLHVTGANGLVLQVYNVLGVRIASIKVEGSDKRIDLPLKSGCYIVKVGNVVRKISINR